MRRIAGLFAIPLASVASIAVASPRPGTIATGIPVEGTVTSTAAHWTDDDSRIVTEATVRTDHGDVVVSQLGGTVDGITMRTFPSAPVLELGMQVAIAADRRVDAYGGTHLVAEDLRVLQYPENFVRTGPTKAGHFLFWESGCVIATPDADGTSEVPGDQEFTAIGASADEWNTQDAGCSYMHIQLESPVKSEVGKDGKNLIKFRDQSWCRPAVGNDPARCYPPSAAGLTTAVFVDDGGSSRDGAIIDADIELNGADFALAVGGVTLGDKPCQSEVQNTLTHEMGHLQGLEHPCLAAGDPPRVDGNGNPVPDCSSPAGALPVITEATMYNFQDCGEMKKESLSQDDTTAICTIYPAADDPGTCGPPKSTGGGCACNTAGNLPIDSFWAFAGAGIVFLCVRRRRR
jgi:hypothetical protein